jgi:hypothetical protein
MSILICDEDLPIYGDNACEVDKLAAISKIAYVKRGQTDITDFSNPTEWLAAIANNTARVTGELLADIPAGTPVTQDNKRACGAATKQVSMDYTATITDPNVSEANDIFYSEINGKSYDIVIFYCKENEIRVLTNGQVSTGIPQSVGNQAETQHYNVTINWRKPNNDFGVLVAAPAGIFE